MGNNNTCQIYETRNTSKIPRSKLMKMEVLILQEQAIPFHNSIGMT